MMSLFDFFMLLVLIAASALWAYFLARFVDYIERRKQRKGWEWIEKLYKSHGQDVPFEVKEGISCWLKK
jgi:hypothetical protein